MAALPEDLYGSRRLEQQIPLGGGGSAPFTESVQSRFVACSLSAEVEDEIVEAAMATVANLWLVTDLWRQVRRLHPCSPHSPRNSGHVPSL